MLLLHRGPSRDRRAQYAPWLGPIETGAGACGLCLNPALRFRANWSGAAQMARIPMTPAAAMGSSPRPASAIDDGNRGHLSTRITKVRILLGDGSRRGHMGRHADRLMAPTIRSEVGNVCRPGSKPTGN